MKLPERLTERDIIVENWKNRRLQTGDTFKTYKKFKCLYCGQKSNLWVIVGRPFFTPHLVCPNGHMPFIPGIYDKRNKKPSIIDMADIKKDYNTRIPENCSEWEDEDEENDDEDDDQEELEDDYIPEDTREYMRTLERYFRLVKKAICKKEVDMGTGRWTKVKAKLGAVWLSKAMYTCPECKNKTCLWTMSNYRYGRPVPVLICKLGHHSYVFDVNLEQERE